MLLSSCNKTPIRAEGVSYAKTERSDIAQILLDPTNIDSPQITIPIIPNWVSKQRTETSAHYAIILQDDKYPAKRASSFIGIIVPKGKFTPYQLSKLTVQNMGKIITGLSSLNIKKLGLENLTTLIIRKLNSIQLPNETIHILENFTNRHPEFSSLVDLQKLKQDLPRHRSNHGESRATNIFAMAGSAFFHNKNLSDITQFEDFNQLGLDLNLTRSSADLRNITNYLKTVRKLIQLVAKIPEVDMKLLEHQEKIHTILAQFGQWKKLAYSETYAVQAARAFMELNIIEFLLQQSGQLRRSFDIPTNMRQMAQTIFKTSIKSNLEKLVGQIFYESTGPGVVKKLDPENQGLQYGGFDCDIRFLDREDREIHIEVDGFGHDNYTSIPNSLRDQYFEDHLKIKVIRLKFDEQYPSVETIKTKLKESGVYDLLDRC